MTVTDATAQQMEPWKGEFDIEVIKKDQLA